MPQENTTFAVQRYLHGLANGEAGDRIVRDLLDRAVRRLQLLCASMLHQRYPRLTRAPVNLDTKELLGGVVERLLKALRQVRPKTVRQFFALANRHIRWELNDLARRLDEKPNLGELPSGLAAARESSDSCLSVMGQRMLQAIDNLPEEEGEAFNLVRIQGLAHTEAAEVLGVAAKTVKRRLTRALLILAERLNDLSPRSNPAK